MIKKRKTTSDAIEILHRRYDAGKPKRIAAAVNQRAEIRFIQKKQKRQSA